MALKKGIFIKSIFYNENQEKRSFRLRNEIGRGVHACVYKLDNSRCLKLLFSSYEYRDETMIRAIMQKNLSSFYKIDEILYDESLFFAAYTMRYYKPSSQSLLDKPMDFTIESLRRVFLDVLKLSKAGIIAADLNNPSNAIVTKKWVVIVDADAYEFEFEEKEAFLLNDYFVYNLFSRLFLKEMKRIYGKDNDILSPFFPRKRYLEHIILTEDELKRELDGICKELSKYNYPNELPSFYER